MRALVALACAFVAGGIAGCVEPAAHSPQDAVGPITGRYAATNLAHNLHVQQLIRAGKTEAALRVLDSSLHQDVYFMQQAEPVMPEGDVYFRLRDRDLVRLKHHWLAHSPKSPHEDIVDYIEATCARIPDCPSEPLRPLNLIREPGT